MKPSTLTVPLGKSSYPIDINSGLTEDSSSSGFASRFQIAVGECSHAVVIQDAAVAEHAGRQVSNVLEKMLPRVSALTIPSGETSKSVDAIAGIWQDLLKMHSDRTSVIVAVGGGVIGDLAGFAAATYTRGLRFVQVPTTLLAMVDSSVGGKTGINLPDGKNMVGSFWQPKLVWIDASFLDTLPTREYLSGLAEVIKYGVIEDAEFFKWLTDNAVALEQRDRDAIAHAVSRSCLSKARVVAEDERETTGRRAILNYGHTFAHAIEATAGYGTMLHGEAVSIGMQMAAHLAIDLGLCSTDVLTQQTALLESVGLPLTWPDADANQMLPVMARDKKVAHGKLRFVLPERIGLVKLVGDVAEDRVRKAINQCC